MNSYILEEDVTDENFDEQAYLLANPDVAKAVREKMVESGYAHYEHFGKNEKRRIKFPSDIIANAKKEKLKRIKNILCSDMPYTEHKNFYDFLTADLKEQFDIIDTDAVSSNQYDQYAVEIITKNEHGLVLDCGAGKRPIYYDNVVNFEIVDYDTTDVRGVGEVLPFVDNVFDAVISIAVLEHVKDPFRCAQEICRVLKPGGQLMCCVPFLQPLHGYPHHYYNMTSQGLENLFSDRLITDKISVYESILPIWSLTWILQIWAKGLKGKTKADFLQMKIGELMEHPGKYLSMPFVQELSNEKNFELASATVLFAHKE